MTPQPLPDPTTTEEIRPDKVAEIMPAIEVGDIRLIDCREPHEWDIAHLDHAELIPLSTFPASAASLVDANTPCIIYCHHGMRSLHATQWLRHHGLARAWSMHGGIDAWTTSIDPSLPRY